MLASRGILNTPPIDDLMRNLRAARWRLASQDFLSVLVAAAFVATAAVLILAAVNRWWLGRWPLDVRVAVFSALGVAFLAVVAALARRKSLPETARVIDRLAATRDRFVTALAFSGLPAASAAESAALQECVNFAKDRKFSRVIRVRLPRETGWLLAPVIALALLCWEARMSFRARDAAAAEALAGVEDTARGLEELARKAEKTAVETDAEHLKKLAEELKRSAGNLRSEAVKSGDPARAALGELSALEALVQQMQQAAAALSAEELKALADALAEDAATKPVAQALAAHEFEKAAEELEKAAREEKSNEALAQALKKLAERREASEALRQLARQMQRSSGAGSEAMRELAQLLKQLPNAKQTSSAGANPQSAQTLKALLAALQAMKQGEGQSQTSAAAGKDGQGLGMVRVQSFAPADASAGDTGFQMPAANSGSEKDIGTTETPFGGKNAGSSDSPQAQQISGQLGEGETLHQMLPSAGDTSKSTRRYRDLYEALAPAAEEAVLQENIPLGSRFFIKRYFESIRPAD